MLSNLENENLHVLAHGHRLYLPLVHHRQVLRRVLSRRLVSERS